MKQSLLQMAIEALENAGFHVDRAYEENNRDAGAICLRITPKPFTVSE